MGDNYLQNLGLGVASLTFGVALSVFIYAAASGIIQLSNLQTIFLAATSFLLMLRFWFRYTELFVKHLPSRTYLHFLFDFGISFFGILAVLLVGNIQLWAAAGAAAMVASIVRCALSMKDAKGLIKKQLKMTVGGSIAMLIVMGIVYYAAPFYDAISISASVLVFVLIFIGIISLKK